MFLLGGNFSHIYCSNWTQKFILVIFFHILIYLWLLSIFYTPLKTPEKLWLSVVFRGYKTGTLAIKGLIFWYHPIWHVLFHVVTKTIEVYFETESVLTIKHQACIILVVWCLWQNFDKISQCFITFIFASEYIYPCWDV